MSYFGAYFGLGAAGVECDYPAEADVLDGVAYAGGAMAGTLAACDYPGEADVRDGVSYAGGASTGTLTVPDCQPDPLDGTICSPADVIQRLLIGLGLVSNPTLGLDWPAYVASEPDRPDDCVTVYDVQGRDFGSHQIDGFRVERRGFQVRVRARTHLTGYPKARQIAEALDTDVLSETVVAGPGVVYCVHCCDRTSDVIPLGKDAPTTKRSLFTVNGLVTMKLLP